MVPVLAVGVGLSKVLAVACASYHGDGELGAERFRCGFELWILTHQLVHNHPIHRLLVPLVGRLLGRLLEAQNRQETQHKTENACSTGSAQLEGAV